MVRESINSTLLRNSEVPWEEKQTFKLNKSGRVVYPRSCPI